MDGLTMAVLATMNSNKDTFVRNRIDAGEVFGISPKGKPDHLIAEAIGGVISTRIGSQLCEKTGFNTIPRDGIHNKLWATFMGQVDWLAIGASYLDEIKEDQG